MLNLFLVLWNKAQRSKCWSISIERSEGSLGTLFIDVVAVGRTPATVELVFFPFDLDPSSSQDIFHDGAVELSEFLVELSIREDSLSENINCSLLIA